MTVLENIIMGKDNNSLIKTVLIILLKTLLSNKTTQYLEKKQADS